jgi:fatty acid synthase
MASGKHIGKIVLKVRGDATEAASLPVPIVARVCCDPELSYVIPGGLGGFGLELADWLVFRGCKKLVLSSSRGTTTSYQTFRVK